MILPKNAEFFIGIFTPKEMTASGVHSVLISGVMKGNKVVPLLKIGRRCSILNNASIFINENVEDGKMTYEAHAISFQQYQELLKNVAYISENQALSYDYQLISKSALETIEPPYKKGIYFSIHNGNLSYKFILYSNVLLEGFIENFNKKFPLGKLAKRILMEEVEALLAYQCCFRKPENYEQLMENPGDVHKNKFYFSHVPEDKFLLRYRFRIEGQIIAGILPLSRPFSKNRLLEYQKSAIAEEFKLLSAYKLSEKKDSLTLHYEILSSNDYAEDNDLENQERLLNEITKIITPFNNCRTAALDIATSILGFAPKISRNFLTKPPYQVSVEDKKINSHSFYILPQPPKLFENFSMRQREKLEIYYQHLRKIPKTNPTSEEVREEFDRSKRRYCKKIKYFMQRNEKNENFSQSLAQDALKNNSFFEQKKLSNGSESSFSPANNEF